MEFASAKIVDDFIRFWRTTATQRFGYMYGHYESYEEVPLGIKAVVEMIYEPPQFNQVDELNLELDWKNEEVVDRIALACGLIKVLPLSKF